MISMVRVVLSLGASALAFAAMGLSAQEPERGTRRVGPPVFEPAALSTIGSDALRFSAKPPDGRWGYVVEVAESQDVAGADGTIFFLIRVSETEWQKWAELPVELTEQEYERLSAAFDRALAEGGASADQRIVEGSDGVTWMCRGDRGYLLERQLDGQTRHLDGSCGNHPNLEISLLVEGLIYRFTP